MKKIRKGRGIIKELRRNSCAYLMVVPAFIYVFIFSYCTLPYLTIAFKKFNYQQGIIGSPWVGLKNFEFFFKSNDAAVVIFNTLFLNLLFIVTGTVASLLLAIIYNELRCKAFVRVTQSVIIFPRFLSWVIVSYMVYIIFSTEHGVANQILQHFGMSKISWYSSPSYWPAILTVTKIWKDAGFNSIIYIAMITGMDAEIFEAARIDGANRLKQIFYITLPMLAPTIAIMTLFSIGKIFYGDFGMIYQIVGDNGLLFPTTDVIDTYVFRAMRKVGDPSVAAAIGLFQTLTGLGMVFSSNALVRKFFPEGALY